MNYGLYLSASGVLANMYRQDVFANNLANANTVGFKREIPNIQPREAEAIEDGFGFDVAKRMLDRLGGGVFAGPQRISFAASSLQKTGNPLDVALDDPHAFFAVQSSESIMPMLTRDGRLTPNGEGVLVMAVNGRPILGPNDDLIRLSLDGPVEIDRNGRVHQSGKIVAQLQITGVHDLSRLAKVGEGLFQIGGEGDLRKEPTQATVKVGFVESSGVDPIQSLLKLVKSTRAITSNGTLIRYHDQLMDRAVNVLGRVG